MFAFPQSHVYYGPSRSNAYRDIDTRNTYLEAVAQTRSAQAHYVAALAREEEAERQLGLSSLHAQDALYPSSYPATHAYHGYPYLGERPVFSHDAASRRRLHELQLRAQRELRLRQLEEQRRLALRRQAEERARCQCPILPKKGDGVEQLLAALFDDLPERRESRCTCAPQVRYAHPIFFSLPSHYNLQFRQSCGSRQDASEAQLRWLNCGGRMRCPREQKVACTATTGPASLAQSKPEAKVNHTPNTSQPAPKETAGPTSLKDKQEVSPQKDGGADHVRFLISLFAPSQAHIPSTQKDSTLLSLKDQLEARLQKDPHVEIRDTLHALIASLVASPATGETKEDSGADKTKGKSKSVSFDIPTQAATSNDVAHALDTVRNVEASFFVLESEFSFPKVLDFSEDASLAKFSAGDLDSDSDFSSMSLERKLAYTARNAPVRYYEHALSALLVQLDAVDSNGSEEVRVRRKAVVERVEKALEEVEREVEVRLRRVEQFKVSPSADSQPAKEVEVTEEVAEKPSLVLASDPDSVVVATEKQEEENASLVGYDVADPTETATVTSPTPALSDAPSEVAPETGPIVDSEVVVDSQIAAEEEGSTEPSQETEISAPLSPVEAVVPDVDTTSIPSSPGSSGPETIDTYLLPAEPRSPAEKEESGSEEDAWSEVEA